MKKLLLSLFTLTIIFSFSADAQSAEKSYMGVKTGIMSIDIKGVEDIVPIGFVLGTQIKDEIYIEGEMNIGVIGGEYEPIPGFDADFDIFTLAGYGVIRHPLNDKIDFKGKLGLLYESRSASVQVGGFKYDVTDTAIGVSLGIGMTMHLVDETTFIDFEYTIIESDVGFLSAGLNFTF